VNVIGKQDIHKVCRKTLRTALYMSIWLLGAYSYCEGFTGTKGAVKPRSSLDVTDRRSVKSTDDDKYCCFKCCINDDRNRKINSNNNGGCCCCCFCCDGGGGDDGCDGGCDD